MTDAGPVPEDVRVQVRAYCLEHGREHIADAMIQTAWELTYLMRNAKDDHGRAAALALGLHPLIDGVIAEAFAAFRDEFGSRP